MISLIITVGGFHCWCHIKHSTGRELQLLSRGLGSDVFCFVSPEPPLFLRADMM